MAVIFMSGAAEATLFKKGDKVVDKRTGDVYEFQYKADIGIYSADSGLGDLFIINGKVYAITPQGVAGMKAVSERTDVRAELKTALKKYKKAKAEAARAWRYLDAEKRRAKLLREAGKNYSKSTEHYEVAVQEAEEKVAALKEKAAEMEQWATMTKQLLLETKDVLSDARKTLEQRDRALHLLSFWMLVLVFAIPVAFMLGYLYHKRAVQRITAKPTEVIEIIDLTDLT
jgi:hypothetical protein